MHFFWSFSDQINKQTNNDRTQSLASSSFCLIIPVDHLGIITSHKLDRSNTIDIQQAIINNCRVMIARRLANNISSSTAWYACFDSNVNDCLLGVLLIDFHVVFDFVPQSMGRFHQPCFYPSSTSIWSRMKSLSTFYWKCASPLSRRRDLIHWQLFSRRGTLKAGKPSHTERAADVCVCTALELISWISITKNRCRKCAIANTMQFLLLVQFGLRVNIRIHR